LLGSNQKRGGVAVVALWCGLVFVVERTLSKTFTVKNRILPSPRMYYYLLSPSVCGDHKYLCRPSLVLEHPAGLCDTAQPDGLHWISQSRVV
jgi:hypothetical protein